MAFDSLAMNVGDEVMIVGREKSIAEISRITPSGIVHLQGWDSWTFNRDGWERGNAGYQRRYLKVPSPSERLEIQKSELAERIEYRAMRKHLASLDIETLKEILAKLTPIP